MLQISRIHQIIEITTSQNNLTQNLRLLKTKMRLGSANSIESEPYSNKNEYGGRNSNKHIAAASFDEPTSALVSTIYLIIIG